MKNILFSYFVLLFIMMGLCCRQNKNLSFDANSLKNPSLFVGDSIMKKQNFFINIASKKGTSILKNINKKYLKNFSKFYKSNLKLSKFENITIKVVKQSSSNLNEIKVNFFTYKNDKKVDSIQFYRNIITFILKRQLMVSLKEVIQE